MGNVRVTSSKKTTVLLLLVLFFIVGGTGSYLLWRVNQEKELSPGQSEAGASKCCCPKDVDNGVPGCYVKCICDYGDSCGDVIPECGAEWNCYKGSDCNAIVDCVWPEVAFCNYGKCTCKSGSGNGCNDNSPQCTPKCNAGETYYSASSSGTCNAGDRFVNCYHNCASCNNEYIVQGCCKSAPVNTCGDGKKAGTEACDPPGSACTTASGKSSTCSSTCTCPEPANVCGDGTKGGSEACDPPGSACTTATGKSSTCSSTCTCPEPIVINKCDALNAKWVTKPTGTIPYGESVSFEYVTGDTDGVQNSTIIVKIDGNSTPVTKEPATGNPQNIRVKGNINDQSSSLLAPGTHKLEISWNDTKGAGGVPCYAYASFTVGAAPVNTCDALGAKWVKQPPSRVEYGKAIPFEYITGDTDGVQNVNILVKLDGTSIPVTKVPTTDNAVNITVKGTLNSDLTLASGSHKLEIAWNDVKGAGGVPCYAYSMISILPENPDWDIEKTAVETCENDWTENPIANLAYTITITNTNTNTGSGIITRIEDTLDPKVDPAKVANISNGGVLEEGKIVWNLTSPLSDFTPGISKSFTYSVSVDKSGFGTYENNVIASTGGSEENSTLEASANIVASCNVPGEPGQPETGLFDDSKNIVLMGGILLFVGLGWSWITDSLSTLKHKMSYESKSRFEKRVSKR